MKVNVIASSHHIIPPKFNTTTKQSPVPRNLARPASKIPGQVNISTTADNHASPAPVSTIRRDDDRTAAFWDNQFLFMSQRNETAKPIALQVVNGAIPSDFPSGSYYLTRPGLLTDHHGSTIHPLDGHGYLRAFEINGAKGEARLMAKYVRTKAQMEEYDPVNDRWCFTYRGPFSILRAGKKLGNIKLMKNVANTSVIKWGKKLMCLWEGGDPYEVDPGAMDTVGKFEVINDRDAGASLEGRSVSDPFDIAAAVLKPILHGVFKMPARRMPSHYKVDAENKRLLVLSWIIVELITTTSRHNTGLWFINSDWSCENRDDSRWTPRGGVCDRPGAFKMPAMRMLSHYKVDAENERLLVLSCNAEDLL